MSDFADDAAGTPPRAPSPTPSQQERIDEKAKAAAELKAANAKLASEAGWVETIPTNYATAFGDGEAGGSARKYEWTEEYGDVAPRDPELELILFGESAVDEEYIRSGKHMKNLDFQVAVEGPEPIEPMLDFRKANLHPAMIENLKLAGYRVPTAIQSYTVPALLTNHDVVAVAQTGSGKTAAYLIPILSKLMGKAKKLRGPRPSVDYRLPSYDHRRHGVRAEPLVVIVVPARELAIQIYDECRKLCYRSMLRPCVAYGGYPMASQVDDLSKGCDILIATPGRLCALMDKPDLLTMGRVKYTIIDEADELLQQDWTEEVTKILTGGDTNEDADHIYVLFSATFPKGARALAKEVMADDYYRIRVGRAGRSHRNINQEIIQVDQDNKRQACLDFLLTGMGADIGRTIIFCSSQPGVDALDDYLYNNGLPSTSIHAGRDQVQREDAIRAFRTGRAPILIATNVACRGLDVANVKYVINFDLPKKDYGGIDEYVHRIGRTGRIGHQGKAISFYTDRDEDLAQELVNTLFENGCEVPEFLSQYAPEDMDAIQFDDDTDEEDGGDGEAEGGEAEGDEGGAPVASDW